MSGTMVLYHSCVLYAAAALILACFVTSVSGSCASFGQSCLGGFGKRAYDDVESLQPYTNDEDDEELSDYRRSLQQDRERQFNELLNRLYLQWKGRRQQEEDSELPSLESLQRRPIFMKNSKKSLLSDRYAARRKRR